MEINDKNVDIDPHLRWYREAKFGLFIHWGAYSVAGAEASWPIMAPDLSEAMFATTSKISEPEYRALPGRFNPVEFDADAWVRAAEAAGMRYIIMTAKHHDGFCMFDAPGTDYKITRTPFGRDVCQELAQACARVGMRLGFYYSPPDMHHPGYRRTDKPATQNWLGEPGRKGWAGYLDYMESHIRKLLTDYGEVSVLWFDGLCNHRKYETPRFHSLIHDISPSTLINDRLGPGYDFVTPEQFIPKAGIPVKTGKPPSGDGLESERFFRLVTTLFRIPGVRGLIRRQMRKYSDGTLELTPLAQERYPSPERFQPWETCMTIGRTWAFNPVESVWKTPRDLLRNLVAVASRGGNYLLNVGPTDKGIFPPQALERLAHVGRWMEANAESIYGSTYTPLTDQPWGCATRGADKVYLHVFNWPADGRLVIEGFPGRVFGATLLSGEKLPFALGASRLEITVPVQAPDPDVSVLVVDTDAAEKGWSDWTQ
ncbi:MAG: alpha-L-fucosidase [Anaerolineae bacterium]